MNPRRSTPMPHPEPVPLPELEDDDDHSRAARDAARLLDVPEWVDPETGELADDEQTRLEDH